MNRMEAFDHIGPSLRGPTNSCFPPSRSTTNWTSRLFGKPMPFPATNPFAIAFCCITYPSPA